MQRESTRRLARIWDLLTDAAASERTVTYGELAVRIGGIARGMGMFLAPIRGYCLAAGTPRLDALVVRRSDGRPGAGHDGGPDPKADRRAVFDHDWTRIPNPYR